MNSQHRDECIGIFEVVTKPKPAYKRINGKVHANIQLVEFKLLLVEDIG